MREADIQNQIVRAFGTRADMRLMRQNVGTAVPYRIIREVMMAMRKGDPATAMGILNRARPVRFGVPGQADLTGIMAGGKRLEIEVKGPTGRQSEDQRNYQAMIERFGGLYVLARCVADVDAALEGHRRSTK